MKKIPLTQGKYAIVDDEWYPILYLVNWQYGGHGYAIRTINHSSKQYMHRVILNLSNNKQVDHINGDRLDNRKDNLRECDFRQNQLNRGLMKTNTTGYKGVYFRKKDKKWIVYIRLDGKNKYSGTFENKIDAAKHYNKLVEKYYGEYARFNEI